MFPKLQAQIQWSFHASYRGSKCNVAIVIRLHMFFLKASNWTTNNSVYVCWIVFQNPLCSFVSLNLQNVGGQPLKPQHISDKSQYSFERIKSLLLKLKWFVVDWISGQVTNFHYRELKTVLEKKVVWIL